MPELPEVQTIVDGLARKVSGRVIAKVWFDYPRAIKYPKRAGDFTRQLTGARILRVERRAKYIKFIFDGSRVMLVHPKMTGHFLFGRWRVPRGRGRVESLSGGALQHKVNSYIHFLFTFEDGGMLAFCDARKFGTLRAGDREVIEQLPEIRALGAEPLDPAFTFARFQKILAAHRGRIKSLLMDQKVIAGLGNIYSDEALWLSKIHPLRSADTLKPAELRALWRAIRFVLQRSLKLRGTSSSDFRDTEGEEGGYWDHRYVYQRTGEQCKRKDGGIIRRLVIGARSAHFCPRCQKVW